MVETKLFLSATPKLIDHKKSKELVNVFIRACNKLNIGIFEPYINEESIFENSSKYVFLSRTKELFDSLLVTTGHSFEVQMKDSVCQGCSTGRKVNHFTVLSEGTKVGEFAFLIDTDMGILKDIYRCYDYEGCMKDEIGKQQGLPSIYISSEVVAKLKNDL